MSLAPTPQPETRVPLTFKDLISRLEWRVELLALALIAAESAIVYLVAGLILPATGGGVFPYWVIALLLLGAHYVTHLLDEGFVLSPDFEVILSGSILITTVIAIKFANFPDIAIWDPAWITGAGNSLVLFSSPEVRPVWGTILLSIYAWWRGRSREEPSLDSSYTMLRLGTLALIVVVAIILVSAPEVNQVHDRLSVATVGYFIAALSAIGIARLRLEGFRSSAPLGGRWLATFAAPILAIGLVAILGAGIFSRQFLDTLLWVLSPVFWVLSVVFQIIVLIIAILAFIILTPIFWLIGDRQVLEATQPAATQTAVPDSGFASDQTDQIFSLPDPIRYLIAAIVLFVIVSLLVRFVFKRRNRQRSYTGEERESVLDWNDLFGSMADRFRSLFRRDPGNDSLAHLRGDERWQYTVKIREHYKRLQARGEDFGRARNAGETAEEYRPVVGKRLETSTEAPPAVNAMTAIYRQARYSGMPAREAEADEMQANWKVVDSVERPRERE